MLSTEEFTRIAEASSEEGKKLLCELCGVSYDTFTRLWHVEEFGRRALAHDIVLIRVERNFYTLQTCLETEDGLPRVASSLVITYMPMVTCRPQTLSLVNEYQYLDPESNECKVEIDSRDVTPSLEKAMARAFELV